jgi:hypothetical protein
LSRLCFEAPPEALHDSMNPHASIVSSGVDWLEHLHEKLQAVGHL